MSAPVPRALAAGLVAALAIGVAGCDQRGAHTPTPLHRQFTMPPALQQLGYQIVTADSGERTENASTGRAQFFAGGLLVKKDGEFSVEEVIRILEGYVGEKVHGHFTREGGTLRGFDARQAPVRNTFRYALGARRGDLHIWLFPTSLTNSAAFALHLEEHPAH